MSLQGMSVLVTGGAGFIGSHIVEDMIQQGAKVKVYDNLSTGLYENLTHFRDQVEIFQGDILDYDSMRRAMQDVDIVSHQAAQLEIFRSTDAPLADLQINTIGTLNVLKAAKDFGVQKVINASSACVYGQVTGSTSEQHLPFPNWAYGVSKLAAERYAKIYNDYHGLPVVSLRYAIVYGEREWYRRVLTIFIKRTIQGKPLVVFGTGDQVRDFVYVADVVRAHRLCLENNQANGEIYNIGTGHGITIEALARLVRKVSGKDLEIIFENTPEGFFSKLVPDKRRNSSELNMMLLNCSKAERDLGWKAITPLAEGIQREMEWAEENLHRWNKIQYTKVVP
jgi:UDP-glucose 4-epimerase